MVNYSIDLTSLGEDLAEVQPTILWHDYETWGVNPMVDFPVQFAAIRTNLALEIIEDAPPINIMCRIPHDYLPQPKACLVTGISPKLSLQKGLSEPEFAKRIYHQISRANTCVAGYNSIRFDDEVTRHLLFRNMYPVYEREYKDNNSRWDIIDLVRACYALRPNGINWAYFDDGRPCFKLEQLSQANNLEHLDAHDALSDVRATIALAKLIKNAQPKLYDYYWQLRNKFKVCEMLQQFLSNVFVYVGSFINSKFGSCTLIMPVCHHPNNNNMVICIDLSKPIDTLLLNEAQTVKDILFSKNDVVDERPGLLLISVNKCPFIAPIKTLDQARANELNIDKKKCLKHFEQLRSCQHLTELCRDIFTQKNNNENDIDIDKSLYLMDFPVPADIKQMELLRHALPEQLETYRGSFENDTLNKVLARYISRNYPELLDEKQLWIWQQHLRTKLTTDGQKDYLSLREYFTEIADLQEKFANNPRTLNILHALKTYGEQLMAM